MVVMVAQYYGEGGTVVVMVAQQYNEGVAKVVLWL